MNWNEIIIQLVDILVKLIVAFAIPAAYKLISKKVTNDKLKAALELSETYFVKAVMMVQQTFVNDLKDKGCFDADSQKLAFNKAVEAYLGMLSEDMQKLIAQNVSDFTAYVESGIEAEVLALKQES